MSKKYDVIYKGKDDWDRDVYKVKNEKKYFKIYEGESEVYVANSFNGEPEYMVDVELNVVN
jgi:hypothetical protein